MEDIPSYLCLISFTFGVGWPNGIYFFEGFESSIPPECIYQLPLKNMKKGRIKKGTPSLRKKAPKFDVTQ